MEKMKKLMMIGVLGVVALYTGCSDDSSSSAASTETCEVEISKSSVTAIQRVPGYSATTTWTIEGDSIKTEYSDFPEKNSAEPANGRTIEDLKKNAQQMCNSFNKRDNK